MSLSVSDLEQVGKLTSVRVGHDSYGPAPSWLLSKLEVAAEGEPAPYDFDIPPQGLWFDAKAPVDARTEREIKVLEAGKKPTSVAKMRYKVRSVSDSFPAVLVIGHRDCST